MTLSEALSQIKRDGEHGEFDSHTLMFGGEAPVTYAAIATILNAVVKGELKE